MTQFIKVSNKDSILPSATQLLKYILKSNSVYRSISLFSLIASVYMYNYKEKNNDILLAQKVTL